MPRRPQIDSGRVELAEVCPIPSSSKGIVTRQTNVTEMTINAAVERPEYMPVIVPFSDDARVSTKQA